jgi:DNA-binding transcriptional MocR family regulator
MERPRSPLPYAKDALAGYYRENGILPSVQTLAQLLGVSSTSSAHYVVQKLREEGYLAANEHGKLTPGPQFFKAPAHPSIPAALLQVLPAGAELRVVRVDDNWKVDDSVWAGDLLVLAPADQVELSHLLVLRRGSTFMLANEPRSGWRAQGVVVGQYRPHGRAATEEATAAS